MNKDLSLAKRLIKECKTTKKPTLDLGFCGIDDLNELPELFECIHLKTLILSERWWDKDGTHESNNKENEFEANNITQLPMELLTLRKISKLICNGDNIKENKLVNIEILQGFPLLEYLAVRDSGITDISFLTKSINLKTLALGFNNIQDVSPLTQLPKLTYLDIGGNPNANHELLRECSQLQYLWLYRCDLKSCDFLAGLTALIGLVLHDNQILDFSPISHLTRLKKLDLAGNNIQNAPLFLFQLGLDIELSGTSDSEPGLDLSENPIESPPIEIMNQGTQSVLDWFEANKQKLNEIKVILIGDPKAGKTSLLRRLKNDTFDDKEPQTDGINIEHIPFGSCPPFKDHASLHQLTAHFWDFGGQEIMNATHQFFLTNRSVYLLVLDARKDQKVAEQIRMWVKRIKATGGNSPIIVVANQADVNPGFGFSNEVDLQQEFPQIKCFLKVSCLTGDGIDTIKHKLEELIPRAELFNTEIDERWIGIMKQLQAETESAHYLSEARFNNICDGNKLPKSGRANAINFLNDLGLVLHFDSLTLADYYVLDPYWITYGVYQIVTSAYAGEQKGIVPLEKLEYILNEEEDKKQVYQPAKYRKIQYDTNSQRRFLVDILNQFKLCFYLPGSTHFIIPDLLDTTEPLTVTHPIRKDPAAISFVYDYDYMPGSVMPRIMVDAHGLLVEKWRTGCVLEYNNCSALVSNYQSRLTITVKGARKQKREFMAVIRNLVNEINKDLTDKPKMLVPLPGLNEFAEYEVLLNRERKGRKEYIHNEDKDTEKAFEISQLLEGIPGNEEMRELRALSIRILANTERIGTNLEQQFRHLIETSNADRDKIINAVQALSDKQASLIMTDIMQFIADSFEIQDNEIDAKLKGLYADLKKSDDVEMKLKLSIPFIQLLGIDLETKIDVKSWAKKMYKKHELSLFKLLT